VFPLVVGYVVLVERKILADFQMRLGPMRVGPHGLLQSIADALKLLIKEDIVPAEADQSIFWVAPAISTFTAFSSFAVLPFARNIFVADINIGLLVISAMSAVGILGIILAVGHRTATILFSERCAVRLIS
jgi:NADH-quinone oxidoreductase subunit H